MSRIKEAFRGYCYVCAICKKGIKFHSACQHLYPKGQHVVVHDACATRAAEEATADSKLVARLKAEYRNSRENPAYEPCGRLERTINEQALLIQSLCDERSALRGRNLKARVQGTVVEGVQK